jgi:hypothetical protein
VNKTSDVAVSKKTGTPVTVKDDWPAKKSTVKTSTPTTKPAVKNASAGAVVKTNDKPIATVNKPVETTKTTIPETKKCNGWPMAKGDLIAAKKAIEEAGKDEAKLTAAQGIIASNCFIGEPGCRIL